LPVEKTSPAWRNPRGTVSGTLGRAERWSSKNADPRRSLYLGWSCMSRRHANGERSSSATISRRRFTTLLLDVHHRVRLQPRQERPDLLAVELRVARLDAQEEAVSRGEGEALGIEDGVVRHRQAVQPQHSEHRRERGEEDRALEGRHDEGRRAV